MSKHTPGPWFYGIAYEADKGPVPFDYRAPGYYNNSGVIGADGTTVVGCDEYDVFHSPADARLITAAPELLEALIDLVSVCDEGDGSAFTNAIAAIAKATGES